MTHTLRRGGLVLLALFLASACAGRRLTLPSGPGTAYPGIASAFEQATSECRGVRSMTASLGLSGRTSGHRLAGRIDTGLAAPARIRLELFPPMAFGRAAFVLAADGDAATLLLPREKRVLRGARPDEIVEALAGVPIGAAELRSVLSGCGLETTAAADGRVYSNGWVAMDTQGTTTYLRQLDGRWRIAAAVRGPITVQYGSYESGSARPLTINFRTIPSAATPDTNLTVTLSDVHINVTLGDEVFAVTVPPDAVPLSLEELRRGMGDR